MADAMAWPCDSGNDWPLLIRGFPLKLAKTINLRILGWICLGGTLCLLAAMWQWSPLSEQLDVNTIAAWLKSIRDQPLAVPAVLAAYVIGSQIMFPITVLILATAYVFGPWLGFVYALAGSVLGAWVTYSIGWRIGSDAYKRLTESRFDAIINLLRRKGLVAVITTHLLPVGPFTFVNLAAGVVRVGGWEFLLGCVIGMLPGIALTAFLERQTEKLFRDPGLITAGLVALSALVIVAFVVWARHRTGRKHR